MLRCLHTTWTCLSITAGSESTKRNVKNQAEERAAEWLHKKEGQRNELHSGYIYLMAAKFPFLLRFNVFIFAVILLPCRVHSDLAGWILILH